jgi:nitronate monooxygenase
MLTRESPLHDVLKQAMIRATERDTALVGRSYGDPARVWRNSLAQKALELEASGEVAGHADLEPLINGPRWMQAMADGDLDGGVFPLGMVAGRISDIPSCKDLIATIVKEASEIVGGRLVGVFN